MSGMSNFDFNFGSVLSSDIIICTLFEMMNKGLEYLNDFTVVYLFGTIFKLSAHFKCQAPPDYWGMFFVLFVFHKRLKKYI